MTDLAERTVRRALIALAREGLIRRHIRKGDNKDKQHLSSEYRLIIRDDPLVNLPEAEEQGELDPSSKFARGRGSKSTGVGDADMLAPSSKLATGGDANLVPELYIEPSKEEDTELRSDAQERVVPLRADIRTQLFREGSEILRQTVGMLRSSAGGQIKKFLKAANDDCGVVLDAMRSAKREGLPPDGMVAFIFGCIRQKTQHSQSTYDTIRSEGGFTSFLTPKLDAASPMLEAMP